MHASIHLCALGYTYIYFSLILCELSTTSYLLLCRVPLVANIFIVECTSSSFVPDPWFIQPPSPFYRLLNITNQIIIPFYSPLYSCRPCLSSRFFYSFIQIGHFLIQCILELDHHRSRWCIQRSPSEHLQESQGQRQALLQRCQTPWVQPALSW